MTREERVLGWVNRVRVEHGKRPLKTMPRGIVGSPCGCPIARGLRPVARLVEVDACGVFLNSETDPSIPAPAYVERFIIDFDEGKFPHLVKG